MLQNIGDQTVISGSKIESLKAIHNGPRDQGFVIETVISGSKIESLKAIHNGHMSILTAIILLSVVQR